MKIAVVLPSSHASSGAERRDAYARHAGAGTDVTIRALPERVPRHADPSDDFVTPEIIAQCVEAERGGADAIIVDCMEDPGVEEARRIVRIPVVGPGHTALRLASVLAYRFSILYPLPQLRLIERRVLHYGLLPRVASIRQFTCGLDALRHDPDAALDSIEESALAAIRQDGAHALVVACTLSSALAPSLTTRLRNAGHAVPVVDGPGAAVKMAEGLVACGLRHSRVTYPAPLGIAAPIR